MPNHNSLTTPSIVAAAKEGCIFSLKRVLEEDRTLLNTTDARGQTALLLAAAKGHNDIVHYLLEQPGIDIHAATNNPGNKHHGKTPLQWAVKGGYCDIVVMLLDAGAIYTPLCSMQFDLIHLAAMEGHLDVVKLLLKRNPELLNKVDASGQTALLLAAAKGHNDIVHYLLEQPGIDILAATNEPESEHHSKTPLQWAIEGKHYSSANLLIHATLNETNQDTIFDFIVTAAMAFEFIILEPKNKALMSRNTRIKKLIDSWKQADEQHIHYYKPAGRRPSFYAEIAETGESIVFHKAKALGRGQHGDVVDFVSSTGEHKAVKYSKGTWMRAFDRDGASDDYETCKKEQSFRKKAYPESANALFFFTRGMQYNIRDVSDFIDGETLNVFFPKIKSVDEVIKLFLLIMEELMALHHNGVLHCDVKDSNIMIDREGHKLKIIDFGNSCLLTDKSMDKCWDDPKECSHIPPEYFHCNNSKRLVPHISFDVYSLGFLFDSLLTNFYKNYKIKIEDSFPSIKILLNQAMDHKPSNRPSLTDFHRELSQYLASFDTHEKSCKNDSVKR